jgi:hypothetical protein
MELIKIFSGSEVESMGITQILDESGIAYVIKNQFESARLAGFGNLDAAVEVYVHEKDIEKATDLIG